MNTKLAFVGDVHGNISALRGIWNALLLGDVAHVIFLGDYINKGPCSAEVLQDLLSYADEGRATFLAGNHELALLDALERED